VNAYKEWSFQLYPSIAFEDVIDKASTLGSKVDIARVIESLRVQECDRFMVCLSVYLPLSLSISLCLSLSLSLSLPLYLSLSLCLTLCLSLNLSRR
jgi:hypothetical protein